MVTPEKLTCVTRNNTIPSIVLFTVRFIWKAFISPISFQGVKLSRSQRAELKVFELKSERARAMPHFVFPQPNEFPFQSGNRYATITTEKRKQTMRKSTTHFFGSGSCSLPLHQKRNRCVKQTRPVRGLSPFCLPFFMNSEHALHVEKP